MTHTTLDHLKADLAWAREDYRYWARQDGFLTRDERAAKSASDRKVAMLENARARVTATSRLCFCGDFDNPTNFR